MLQKISVCKKGIYIIQNNFRRKSCLEEKEWNDDFRYLCTIYAQEKSKKKRLAQHR